MGANASCFRGVATDERAPYTVEAQKWDLYSVLVARTEGTDMSATRTDQGEFRLCSPSRGSDWTKDVVSGSVVTTTREYIRATFTYSTLRTGITLRLRFRAALFAPIFILAIEEKKKYSICQAEETGERAPPQAQSGQWLSPLLYCNVKQRQKATRQGRGRESEVASCAP